MCSTLLCFHLSASKRKGQGLRGGGRRLLEGKAQQGDEEAAREADICAQTDRVSLIRSLLLSLQEINNLPEQLAGRKCPAEKVVLRGQPLSPCGQRPRARKARKAGEGKEAAPAPHR